MSLSSVSLIHVGYRDAEMSANEPVANESFIANTIVSLKLGSSSLSDLSEDIAVKIPTDMDTAYKYNKTCVFWNETSRFVFNYTFGQLNAVN